MKRTKIAGIDVGTTKVCTIMADTDGGSWPRILGVGIVPSQGLQKGMIVNFNEARQSIIESVKKAEQSAGSKIDSVYVGVTGRHISSMNNKGVISINRTDRMVHPKDLKRVLDVARSIKMPGDRKLLHVIPRTYAVDGQEGVNNPVGMHGFRLDVETHIISAAVTSVQNLVKCIRSAGLEIEELVLEPLASAEAVLTEDEKMNGVMIADIGGGTTDIAIFKDNSIYHTSVLPVAGYQITKDIGVGLGVSYEIAEEMKKRYGNVTPEYDGESQEADSNINMNSHVISHRDLSDIVRIRVEELLRLIMMEVPSEELLTLIPSGIVLTGGSSNLPGIAQLGSEVTHMPFRIGTPLNLHGVSDNLADPAYATAVGLLLWKKNFPGSQGWETRTGLQRFTQRVLRLFR